MKRRTRVITQVSSGVLLIGLCLLGYSVFIEPKRLVVTEQPITVLSLPPALDGLRVVAVSDLHIGAPFMPLERLRDIVARINALNPDVILLLGDYVIQDVFAGKFVEPEPIARELAGLRAKLGVFAVAGNHDWWYNGERVIAALRGVGIRVLEDQSEIIERNGGRLYLAGLADLWTRPQNIQRVIDAIPANETVIAFTHNPDIFPDVPLRVPLLVAGHTHGGQVNLPLLGRRIVPSKFGERYAAGLIAENSHQVFVTTGVGTSIVPVRFRVPPEIALITLRR